MLEHWISKFRADCFTMNISVSTFIEHLILYVSQYFNTPPDIGTIGSLSDYQRIWKAVCAYTASDEPHLMALTQSGALVPHLPRWILPQKLGTRYGRRCYSESCLISVRVRLASLSLGIVCHQIQRNSLVIRVDRIFSNSPTHPPYFKYTCSTQSLRNAVLQLGLFLWFPKWNFSD